MLHREKKNEIVPNGLPLWQGAQLVVDTALVSPVRADGEPRHRANRVQGTALTEARRAKERTYPELLATQRSRLVVIGIEVGGMWSSEAAKFLKLLAKEFSAGKNRSPSRKVPSRNRPFSRASFYGIQSSST